MYRFAVLRFYTKYYACRAENVPPRVPHLVAKIIAICYNGVRFIPLERYACGLIPANGVNQYIFYTDIPKGIRWRSIEYGKEEILFG